MMRIKNWEKFQHFKDRRPPWIKLYRDLLDDADWHELDPKKAKFLVMLWLIASENHGELPNTKQIAFRLRIATKEANQLLNSLESWLIQDDINAISTGYQPDAPETETETETDIVAPVSPSRHDPKAYLETLGVSESVIADWISLRKTKKAPATKTAIDGLLRESEKAGWTLSDALAYSCERGWTGFKAEWVDGIVPKKENLSDTVTLPDGRQMPRATFDFMQRMGV